MGLKLNRNCDYFFTATATLSTTATTVSLTIVVSTVVASTASSTAGALLQLTAKIVRKATKRTFKFFIFKIRFKRLLIMFCEHKYKYNNLNKKTFF